MTIDKSLLLSGDVYRFTLTGSTEGISETLSTSYSVQRTMKDAGNLEVKDLEFDFKAERTKNTLFVVYVAGSVSRLDWVVKKGTDFV